MSTENFDPSAPLESIRGETKKANHAFREYCYIGPARSLKKLRDRLDLSVAVESDRGESGVKSKRYAAFSTICEWSSRYFWVARAAAFDLQEDVKRADLWRERREKIRETDYQVADELRTLAASVLAAGPNFIRATRRRVKGETRIGKDGAEYTEPDTILVTTALDGDLLIKLVDLASKLQRAAAGIANTNFVFPVDWSQLTDEQVSAIASGENPIEVLAKGTGGK